MVEKKNSGTMGNVPLWDGTTCGLATPDCCIAGGREQRTQGSTSFHTPDL